MLRKMKTGDKILIVTVSALVIAGAIVTGFVRNNTKSPVVIVSVDGKEYGRYRIDKDTPGIVMFAKNEETKRLYQDSWEDIVKLREYIAIVSGTLDQKEGIIQTYLTENTTGLVYSTKKRR